MPKMKTHSGTKKRVKKSGTGKLRRQRANKRHLLEHKSSKQKRRLSGTKTLAPGDAKLAKRLLGDR